MREMKERKKYKQTETQKVIPDFVAARLQHGDCKD